MEITREHKKAVAHILHFGADKLGSTAISRIVAASRSAVDRMLKEFVDGKIAKEAKKLFDFKAREWRKVDDVKVAEAEARFQFVMTNKTLTVIKNGKPQTADKTHRHYDDIHKACQKKDYSKAYELMSDKEGVLTFAGGLVEVFEGHTIYQGVQINSEIGKKIVTMVNEGREDVAEAFANFMVRVFRNPDDNMHERLFAFCQYNDIKIEKDGMVLTYKVVSPRYLDLHSGKFDNSPGRTVQVPREMVDSNPDATCSYGLHVCSIAYLNSFGNSSGGDKIVLCRVDPADFVAVPRDYGNRKARVLKYEVLADVTDRGRKILGYDDIKGDEENAAVLKMDRAALQLEKK